MTKIESLNKLGHCSLCFGHSTAISRIHLPPSFQYSTPQ